MDGGYWLLFFALLAVAVAAQLLVRLRQPGGGTCSGGGGGSGADRLFTSFQANWLLVYYLVMGADWLQGPYVYALYQSYGFGHEQIAVLFIAGFGASMVFGTVAGALADKYGRRTLCLTFGLLYSLSCITKLVPDFWVLMAGRLLGGTATSLLFSCFEAWMVQEHSRRRFGAEALGATFSLATFGNGVVAIASGLVATAAADAMGYVAPFMVSLSLLVVASAVVAATWDENYGDQRLRAWETLSSAWRELRSDARIVLLGAAQGLFEAAMYTFVFMWTPALANPDPPYGLVFACFMVCVMLGSTIFSLLLARGTDLLLIGRGTLAVAAVALAIPVLTSNRAALLAAFLLFETCCGVYWPCFGMLRSRIIPEHSRAAIMNFFRIPLNLLVVVVLLQVSSLSTATTFFITTLWLALAFVLANYLAWRRSSGTINADGTPTTPSSVSHGTSSSSSSSSSPMPAAAAASPPTPTQ